MIEICENCDGSGLLWNQSLEDYDVCQECNGYGRITYDI